MLEYLLTYDNIVDANYKITEGEGTVIKPHLLSSIVDSASQQVFGHELYPGIVEKAAHYWYKIIKYHVFSDGNKRTGLMACMTFLVLNDYDLDMGENEEFRTCLQIAQSEIDESQLCDILSQYIVHVGEE